MIENSAPMPQIALASVNQSAKWKSRIIENGFGGVGVVMDRGGWSFIWLCEALGYLEFAIIAAAAARTILDSSTDAPLLGTTGHCFSTVCIAKYRTHAIRYVAGRVG